MVDHPQTCLEKLFESAGSDAVKKGERLYMEQLRKSVKADLMEECSHLPLGAQERSAYSDSRYKRHLIELREAIVADETAKNTRAAREMIIEAWRTSQASKRILKV